jgi:hypothetical protein
MFIKFKVKNQMGGPASTSGEAGEVRERLFRLIKSSLTLAFVLIFLGFLRPELTSLLDYIVEGLSVSSSLILNAITLAFIVYFGYFILIDAKYFLDKVSVRFGQKDRGKLQTITYDIAGLISLFLVSALITPFLALIQTVGGTISRIFNIVLLGIGFFIVYHLANQIYSVIRQRFEKLIQNGRQFKANHSARKREG